MVLGLALVNLTTNRLVSDRWYVPVAIFVASAMVLFAHRGLGISWDDLGLAPRHLRKGLRWGTVLVAIVVATMVIGVLLPGTRQLFEDDRVRDMSGWDVIYAAFVRVTFGTVLLEEIAFRAVAPAMLATRMRRWKAIGIAAVLFGLWHVLPSLNMNEVNPVATDTVGQLPQWVTVAGSVGSTAVVGIWFSFLREKTGSVVTPMLAHWSTNAVGYLFAYGVIQWL